MNEAPAEQQQTSQGESDDAASVIIGAILGQVLKPQQKQGATQAAAPTEAVIHAAAGITNAFALEIELRALPGTRRGVYCVRSTGVDRLIDWRPRPCYSCSKCGALKCHLCKRPGCGKFVRFDLAAQ